jgi:hypothetical protein
MTLDSSALCSYCDQELPIAPSSTLTAMEERLYKASWPNPLEDYPNHQSVPLITMTVDYCARHRFERDQIPVALAHNWPFKPNFARLFHRILELGPILRTLCKNVDTSHFFIAARQYYGNKVTQLSSMGSQYLRHRMFGAG